MTAKWALFVDVALCHNCRNCYIACKDEYVDNDYPGYSAPQPKHGHEWIGIRTRERGEAPMLDVAHLPVTCNHCEEAPCMRPGDDAVRRREDGIVIIDPQKARGRRDLVDACPYGAIWWNEAEQLPQKWTFDAHLLDRGWSAPRCVTVCPTGALTAARIEDTDLRRKCDAEGWTVLNPEFGTRPRVFYRNLHRFDRCFIGATVLASGNGVVDCLAGARIRLLRGDQEVATTISDDFGEFKLDGLEPGSGRYVVEISSPSRQTRRLEVELGESRYLGTVVLEADAADQARSA